jgi:hypothetical protein
MHRLWMMTNEPSCFSYDLLFAWYDVLRSEYKRYKQSCCYLVTGVKVQVDRKKWLHFTLWTNIGYAGYKTQLLFYQFSNTIFRFVSFLQKITCVKLYLMFMFGENKLTNWKEQGHKDSLSAAIQQAEENKALYLDLVFTDEGVISSHCWNVWNVCWIFLNGKLVQRRFY